MEICHEKHSLSICQASAVTPVPADAISFSICRYDSLTGLALHACLEFEAVHAILVGDDADGHIFMACPLDLLAVEPQQGRTGLHFIPDLHQILKTIPLHIHRIETDMEQDLHTIRQYQPHCVARILSAGVVATA